MNLFLKFKRAQIFKFLFLEYMIFPMHTLFVTSSVIIRNYIGQSVKRISPFLSKMYYT